MLERRNKPSIAGEPFVPPAILPRKSSSNKNFIYWCIKLQVGKALCKCLGIFGKVLWKIGVLKITQPIGHAKVAKVYNRRNVQFLQPLKRHIGKLPIVFAGGYVRFVIGRAITQKANAHIFHQFKILLPFFIMPAFFHFIYPLLFAIEKYGGITIFNARGKHKLGSSHSFLFLITKYPICHHLLPK